jgi:hypothetical protein
MADEQAKRKPIEPTIGEQRPAAADDPFSDLSKLRINQNFAETVGVKKLLRTVPVRKPGKQEWVRVHRELRLEGAVLLELEEDREIYLVMPNLVQELSGEVYVATLHLAINRQGVVFLWPTRGPGPDGRDNEYWRTAREFAEMGWTGWIKIKANQSLRAYEVFDPENRNIPEPDWPTESFEEILRVAFRDRLIDRPDHPVIKRLRGAA